jgi:hypothetical protein
MNVNALGFVSRDKVGIQCRQPLDEKAIQKASLKKSNMPRCSFLGSIFVALINT